jgi:hypothetical protein
MRNKSCRKYHEERFTVQQQQPVGHPVSTEEKVMRAGLHGYSFAMSCQP